MNPRVKLWLGRVRPVLAPVAAGIAAFALGALIFGGGDAGPSAGAQGHAEHTDPAAAGTPQPETWTCSMHPQIRQPEAGQCPICGMDLIPLADDAGSAEMPASRVSLSPRAQALARLRTVEVRRLTDPALEVRLLGRIEPDESSLKTVTSWIGGRIDKLQVRTTGERVAAGQVIATLYSPEVLAAHQDLLSARRQADRIKTASATTQVAARAAFDAARERLVLLGVPEAEVSKMESAERPSRQIAIRSPFAGTVIERLASEGAYVATGAPLYRLANLSRLWVQLDAYESDLPSLAVGQSVRIEVEAVPTEPFEGRVAFIEPTVDPRRRTARVRVEVRSRDGRLRPGMFAQAVVQGRSSAGGEAPLVVPSSAPLFTGRRSMVYVEVPDSERPSYDARVVRLGPRMGDAYPVVAGLNEGERVVVRGAFALDADLQIRGGASMMSGQGDAESRDEELALQLTPADRKRLEPVLDFYLEAGRLLAADDLPGARDAAGLLGVKAKAIKLGGGEVTKVWSALRGEIVRHAHHVHGSDTIESARSGFEQLSAAIELLLKRFGNPLDQPVHLAFCPMAFGSRGGSWLQRGEQIDNVYFGAAMRRCGEIKSTVAPGAHLIAPGSPQAVRPAPAGGHNH